MVGGGSLTSAGSDFRPPSISPPSGGQTPPTTPSTPSFDANKYKLAKNQDFRQPRNAIVRDLEQRLADIENEARDDSANVAALMSADETLSGLSDMLRESKSGVEFIDALIIAQMKRLEVYDAKIQFMINKIEIRNTYMSQLNNIIQTARDSRPNKSDEKTEMPSEVIHFMRSKGLETPDFDEELTPEKYDQFVISLKGLLDDESNEAQLDMTRMQRQINYRNQVYDTMVSYLSKILKNRETIIANTK